MLVLQRSHYSLAFYKTILTQPLKIWFYGITYVSSVEKLSQMQYQKKSLSQFTLSWGA